MSSNTQSTEPLRYFAKLLAQQFPEQAAQFYEDVQSPISSNLIQLAHVISLSDFVQKVLQNQPHLLADWWKKMPTLVDCGDYSTRLTQALSAVQNEENFYRVLRQFRYREMAKLSACQSLNLGTVEQIFERLSQLAESIIIGARDWLYIRACEEMGTPCDAQGNVQQLYILGMGKLGGFELNFSSDVDLIFTYPSQGETVGGRKSIDNSKFFTRLGQRLINALDQFTLDGFVYRTDMRLRPFGDSGALALSFNAMEQYYQDQGRDWERYAMIKARILGADAQDPNVVELQKRLRPFVYRRYIDFSVIQSLREMKQKIEREIRRRGLTDNIKLGAGGIREIEFIAQVFQLMRGGREVSLQETSILAIFVQLAKLNLLEPTQVENLRQAYLFLRRVENVLQAIDDKQTQQLPNDERSQARLILACSTFTQFNAQQQIEEVHYPMQTWEDFCQVLHTHQTKVRSIFQNFIGEEEPDNEENDDWKDFLALDWQCGELASLLPHNTLDNETLDRCEQRLLQFRQNLTRYPITDRGHAALTRLMPSLLQQIFQHTHCATLLPRMLNIVEKILTRTTYLELLVENPRARAQLIELCAQSEFIAQQVARYPILLDELLDHKIFEKLTALNDYGEELHQFLLRLPEEDEEQFIDGLRQFKQAALLKIAAADILGKLPVMKVSDHLTFLAEAIIAAVVNLAWRQIRVRFGVPDYLADDEQPKGFLVIGYGKLGGLELGYKSDLDLVFLYETQNGQTAGGKKVIDNHQFYMRLAQKIVSIFSLNTSAGVLYDVDMRLRPAGDAGLLGCSFNAFENYQMNEAWTWEKQALVRSRAIFGESALQEKFSLIRHNVLSAPRDVEQLKKEVVEMRQKMYQHLGDSTPNQFNLKTDRGGITDIEFIAQYLVLTHAPTQPILTKWSDNVRIFEIMAEYDILNKADSEKLKQAYVDLRNQVHHLNLLGLPLTVPTKAFKSEREFVINFWHKLFDDD